MIREPQIFLTYRWCYMTNYLFVPAFHKIRLDFSWVNVLSPSNPCFPAINKNVFFLLQLLYIIAWPIFQTGNSSLIIIMSSTSCNESPSTDQERSPKHIAIERSPQSTHHVMLRAGLYQNRERFVHIHNAHLTYIFTKSKQCDKKSFHKIQTI